MVKHDSWEKEEDLENVKELVAEFEGKINAKVRRQEKLDLVEEKDFRRGEFVKIVRSGLSSLLFSFIIFILFSIYFYIFYL